MRKKMIVTGSLVVVVFGILSAVVISIYSTARFGRAYALGSLLGVANGAVGFLTIEKFIDKSTLVFLRGVFLGMGVRLALLLGVFVLFMYVVRVDASGMISGLFVFYFTMTVLEVIFLNKRIELRKAMGESSK